MTRSSFLLGLVGMEHCSNWDCAEHVRNTFPKFYIRYASIMSIWIFARMEMVDMTNLRIRFVEIEKCKHFLKLIDFKCLNPFACHWHPAGAFFLVKIAILDVRNMCGTRCAEHGRNAEHVPNLWNRVPCQLSLNDVSYGTNPGGRITLSTKVTRTRPLRAEPSRNE